MGLTADTILIGLYLSRHRVFTMLELKLTMESVCLNTVLLMCLKNTEKFLSFGDFNARTGDKNAKDVPLPDSIFPLEKDECDVEEQYRRKSNDVITNDFGRYLLNVCEQFGLVILNGLLSGERD